MITVIIFGMHRSGTSLTSALCQSSGLDIGKNLINITYGNPLGHFENEDFVGLHDYLLSKANGAWNKIPDSNILEEVFNKNILKVKEVIDRNKSDFWGFKDPRMSLFFHLYVKNNLLENPRFIICWRNINSVAYSLASRDCFSYEEAFNLALEYYSCIIDNLSYIRNYPILNLNFEDYFINPELNINKLKSFLGVAKINKALIVKEFRHW